MRLVFNPTTGLLEPAAGDTGGSTAPAAAPSSVLVQRTAASPLSGHRAVVVNAADQATYADQADPTVAAKQVFLTVGAAEAGATATLLAFGAIDEPSWSWNPALPVYLGAAGALTQTYPATGVGLQVATVEKPTRLFWNPTAPIVRAQ